MTSTDRPPRRRLSAETRRSAIVAAATAAFASQPYDEVSVARLAAEAGVSEALVYRYFDTKPSLYASVIQQAADDLAQRQAAADAALPPAAAARERVRARLEAFLDHLADPDTAAVARLVLTGHDLPAARAVWLRTRSGQIEQLRSLLMPDQWVRQEYALWGYLGFVERVSLQWLDLGCPADQRYPLIDAALGALEGALGDWGR